MNRVITQAELAEELRVGTVDLSRVTVASDAVVANLRRVAESAAATVPVDERAADAIEAADAEAAAEAELEAAEAE